jgi:hypothetical protein
MEYSFCNARKNMKRIALVVVTVLMGSTLLFAGGRQAGSASQDGLTVIKAWGLDKQYALDNRSIALSEWVSGSVPSRIFEKFTEKMAEIGVRIEYELVMADQLATAFQTMLASGQINNYDWIAPVDVDIRTRYNLINQRALYPLNQAIQQYSSGPAKEFFFNDPAGKQIAALNTVADGNFYWLTQHSVGGTTMMTSAIRKDWLDKLGLPVPTTLDEFYTTLVAFQENDVNGNGIKDEVASASSDGMSFVAQWYGLPANSIVDPIDGKAVSPWYQPQIKEYFTYMNRLFRAGLLSIASEGGSNVSNVTIENRSAAHGAYVGDIYTEPTVVTPPGAPKAYYMPFVIQAKPGIEPRVLEEGGVMQWHGSGMYSVPARTKNIEKIVKMIDAFESHEYQYLNEQGIEGYTYRWLPDNTFERLPVGSGNVGADQQLYWQGLPGLWSGWQGLFPRARIPDPARTPTKEASQESSRKQMVDAGQALGYPEGFLGKYEMIVKFENNTWKTIPSSADGVLAFATVQESERLSELTPDLNTYVSELITALVMGEKSLNDWDSYIANLKRLGLDEVISIYQARLDRMK